MIQDFVDKFMAQETALKTQYIETPPGDYGDIVKDVVKIIAGDGGYGEPDPENIREINDGDYQGTLLFIIAANGYQPYTYWATKVSYGSCSGCDTFQAIQDDLYDWSGNTVSDEVKAQAAQDYWTLALHIVQQMQEI